METTTGSIALHNIKDVYGFVYHELEKREAFRSLSYEDREQAVQELVLFVWELANVWTSMNGSKPKDLVFSGYVRQRLGNKFIDHMRKDHMDLRYESQRGIVHEPLPEDFTEVDQEQQRGGTHENLKHYDRDDNTDDISRHELLERIDVDLLTQSSYLTLVTFAIPMHGGKTVEQLSQEWDIKEDTIMRRLRKLSRELEAQS